MAVRETFLVIIALSSTSLPLSAQESAGSPDPWSTVVVGPASLIYAPEDAGTAVQLAEFAEYGLVEVETFFGAPYAAPFDFRVFPNRKELDEWWANAWGIPDLETQCWMVGSGEAETLALLSPRAYGSDACEHDASNTERIQKLVTHELVHVYHLQLTPAESVELLEPIGWFVEGLAVYASGQLSSAHLNSARESIETGNAIERLEDGWSGSYRYGVSGSLVQYIDLTYGRDMTIRLVTATSEAEILDALGTSESELLSRWERFVVDRQSSDPSSS